MVEADEIDALARQVAAQGDDDAIRVILADVCRITGMGFAAVARVTDTRWIACQVIDRIDFGLNPGDELRIKTTLCDDIRASGEAIVIDHIDADIAWQTHPVPAMYGFQSYASFPVVLPDGRFYGTLCAIDPAPRVVSGDAVLAAMRSHAAAVAAILAGRGAVA